MMSDSIAQRMAGSVQFALLMSVPAKIVSLCLSARRESKNS